jgi:competence protein ComEC
LYGFIANAVAVPLVTLLGLPALFGIALISFVSVEWAQFCLAQLDVVWSALWWFLEFLAALPYSNWSNGALPFVGLLGLYALLFLGVWFKKPVLKWGALASFVVLLAGWLSVPHTLRPEFGQAWVTVLDVGQAQAVVIETQNHVMVVDTGAKWGDSMDGAKMAIVPYLRAQNWSSIDMLMVSHSDLDHAGGVQTLLDTLPIKQLLSGQADVLNAKHFLDPVSREQAFGYSKFEPCLANQAWSVDGIAFRVLSPTLDDVTAKRSDNDLSCVLKVGHGTQSVLIAGDLSTAGEKRLLARLADLPPVALPADLPTGEHSNSLNSVSAGWLIAGHHGSKHSTSNAWLQAVNPHTLVFSAGYLNRFGFPNTATVERVGKRSIVWYNTACSGAVQFKLDHRVDDWPVEESRKTQRKWYHHACLDTQKGVLFE